MSKKETAGRYILFIISLFFSAMGVAFTKHGELGVSPVSSVANIMSLRFEFFTMGTWLVIWNIILILGQIIILQKKFNIIQLLQIPLSFLFGWFTDIGLSWVSHIPAELYPVRVIMVVIGVTILGFGISLAVTANVIMNSGEAFVKAISDTWNLQFGNIKIIFDISCVVLSVVLSLLFFDMKIVGTREGTLISALLTGLTVKFFINIVNVPINNFLIGKGKTDVLK